MEIMVKCRNMRCRSWFLSDGKQHQKYCSKKCSNQVWKERRWGKAPILHPEVFHCPFCGKTVKYIRQNQQTCGSEECLAARKKQIHTMIREGEYIRKKHKKPENTDHKGRRECLWCGKTFVSPDIRNVVFCRECRWKYRSAQHEYRFAPAGW